MIAMEDTNTTNEEKEVVSEETLKNLSNNKGDED